MTPQPIDLKPRKRRRIRWWMVVLALFAWLLYSWDGLWQEHPRAPDCPPPVILKDYLPPTVGLASRDAWELRTASGFRMRVPAKPELGNTTHCANSPSGVVVDSLSFYRHWDGEELVMNSIAYPLLWVHVKFGRSPLPQRDEPEWRWQKPETFSSWGLTLYRWANALTEHADPGEFGSLPTLEIAGTQDPRRGRAVTLTCFFKIGTTRESLRRYEAGDATSTPEGNCRVRWGPRPDMDVLVEFDAKWLPDAKEIYQAYQQQIQSYIVLER